MAKVTVIAEDSLIIVNGEPLEVDSTFDDNLWAIQWDGTQGHIEYRDNTVEAIESFDDEVKPYVDVFNAKKIQLQQAAENVVIASEQLTQAAQQATQDALDTKAQEREYDGILSLCSYAASAVDKFKSEGQAGVIWRDGAWAALYQLRADIAAGTVLGPTSIEESKALALSVLPLMRWPDEVNDNE